MVIYEEKIINKETDETSQEKEARIERGKRLKYIREKEKRMSKKDFGSNIGVSGQFVGIVEDGKANYNYKNIKKISEFTGYTADYLLFGQKEEPMENAKICARKYTTEEINKAIEIMKEISRLIKI